MQLKIDNFHGIQPRLHPTLLGDGMAVRAHNCRLKNGKLVPLREPAVATRATIYLENGLGSVGDAKTLYCWKYRDRDEVLQTTFLAFPKVVSVAEGNIADDERSRLFVTGATGMSWTDAEGTGHENVPVMYFYNKEQNSIYRRTILKSAPAAPVASVGEQTLDPSKTTYYVYFFASWFSEDGYESPLSGASELVELNDGMMVSFAAQTLPREAVGLRIYASAAGTSEATDGIQFFAEHMPGSGSSAFSKAYNPAALGETEPGIESPPVDLCGVRFVAGGYYCGYSRSSPHTVMFSDIGIVTSWPIAYRYDIKDNIVALATTSNSVFALTDGWPWVLSGTAPESMSVTKLAGPAACVSARSVCVYRNSVYYASNEGLMVIANDANAGTVCANLTQKVFTKDQWLEKNPASCMMEQYDGALFLFFRDKNGRALPGLTIDLNESADAVTTHEEAARCLCVDNATDKMYFVREIGGMSAQEGGEG